MNLDEIELKTLKVISLSGGMKSSSDMTPSEEATYCTQVGGRQDVHELRSLEKRKSVAGPGQMT